VSEQDRRRTKRIKHGAPLWHVLCAFFPSLSFLRTLPLFRVPRQFSFWPCNFVRFSKFQNELILHVE
jgi:hypothetical protein